jgi:hypothetical protein
MVEAGMEEKFPRWMKRIRDTQPDEIDCSACLDQVSQYVDLELAGSDAAGNLPLVKQHLEQCGVCFEEYQALRELARLELDGSLPSQDELSVRLKNASEDDSSNK